MKKIAIVTEFYLPHIGGQEIRFQELAEQFEELGFEIDIYTICYNENLQEIEKSNNITIHRIIKDYTYESGGGIKSRSPKTIILFSWFVCRLLLKKNYEFIIFNQFPLLPIIFSKIMRIKTKKIIDFVEYRNGFLWSIIQKLIIFSADEVVCISNSVARKIRSLTGVDGKVIPSLVNQSKFHHSNSEYFIYVGRLETHKHPESAIESVIHFNKKYNCNYDIHLIGNGSMFNQLKNSYGSNKNVFLHGFVDEDKKSDILSKALAMILPSEREGLPKSVIEAVACGIPIITTDYPENGTKDFVDEYNIGIVTKPTLNDLTGAIRDVIKNWSLYNKKCNIIKDYFSLTAGAKDYLKVGQGG